MKQRLKRLREDDRRSESRLLRRLERERRSIIRRIRLRLIER